MTEKKASAQLKHKLVKLLFCGHPLKRNSGGSKKIGFEKITYLLLMGKLPNGQKQMGLPDFMSEYSTLPSNFTRDVTMKAPIYTLK